MMKKIFAMLMAIGFVSLSMGQVKAATEEEIIAQVDTYITTGAITDVNFASSLKEIVGMAITSRNEGDAESQTDFRNAFREAVDEVCAVDGQMISSSDACTTLAQMAL